MEEIADIYGVRNFYFSLEVRNDLTLLCSDEECRKTGTKVTGVNYKRLIEEKDKYLKPHFRKLSDHILNCEWVEREQALQEIKEEAAANADESGGSRRRSKTPKSTDVVDIFEPSVGKTDKQVETLTEEFKLKIKSIKDRKARLEAYKNYFRTNPSRTNILENVLSCYDDMEYEDKVSTFLTIRTSRGSQRRSYASVFTYIRNYVPGRDEERIYLGGAKVKKAKGGYRLTFIDWTLYEDENGLMVWHQIDLYFKKDDLTARRRQGYLLAMLQELADDEKQYARCCFYGRITKAKVPRHLDVTIAHFNNLVVMKKSNPQK